MATLFHCPTFLSLSSRKLLLGQQQEKGQQQHHKLNWDTQEHPPRKHLTICASSNKKPRGSRKVKSNVELCNDIREFVTSVGLRKDHVPSLKELTLHGRNDLANIVRRRGYKLIRELIASSTKSEIDGPDPTNYLDANQGAISYHEDSITGRDKKVNSAIEDISLSTVVFTMGSDFCSSDTEFKSNVRRCLPIEPSSNSFSKEKVSYGIESHSENVDNMAESISLPSEVSTTESSSSIDQCLNTDYHSLMPLEFSVNSSQEEKDSSNLQVQDDKVNMVEDSPFSTGGRDNYPWSSNSDFSPDNLKSMPTESSAILSLEERPSSSLEDRHEKIITIDPARISGDDSCMPIEVSSTPSFEEKVARFIQHGHLDMIHDESADEESKEIVQPQNLTVPHGLQHSEAVLNGGNAAEALNGSMLTSKEDLLSSEGLMTAQLDEDLDVESGRKKQAEINRLKFMLHQKELELSQLKEQIGKEKLALSDLQTKAGTEISRAQKLISEKDAELNAAEESLSGLEEVEIQYCGDGEIVEVSGSFNGWHQRIKMDPQLSSSVLEPMTSRKSRVWSTVLWLYPGIYEIKFIVDGQWRIDPLRESVTRGTICNNILRVDQ